MENKRVTVCIPVYNGEKYIKSTIESVLRQSYNSIKIVVIDNCSTDNTKEVVSQFRDVDIVYIENENNVGMVGNFNRCLECVSTEYFLILCADDYIEKDCIAQKVAVLDAHPNCSFAISASNIMNDEGKHIFIRRNFRGSHILNGVQIYKKSFRKFNMFGEPSNTLIRTEAARKAGNFSEEMYYAVDWEYWLRLCREGDVYYIDEPLSRFYLRKSSESSKLIKTNKNILEDDKKMVAICKAYDKINLSLGDVVMHNINTRIRLLKKIVFSILFN